MVVSIWAISSTTMFRSLVGMLPGPEALCGLRFLRSFMTHGVDVMIGSIDGMLL